MTTRSRPLRAMALAMALAGCSHHTDSPEVVQFKAGKGGGPHGTIPAQFAGVYYPSNADALSSTVKALLDNAGLPAPGPVTALVVPRAGYAYAGPTLASAFAAVRDRRFERVVILAASPNVPAGHAVLPEARGMLTPLGEVSIDPGSAALLAEQPGFSRSDDPYRDNHSVEVILPFIQVALGKVPIVPLQVGVLDAAGARELAGVLAQVLDSGALLVVSTDITQYGPRFGYLPFGTDVSPAAAKAHLTQADEVLLNPVLLRNLKGFDMLASRNRSRESGQDALRLLLAALPTSSAGTLRRYELSSKRDTSDRDDMVSYAGIVFKGSWPDVAPLSPADGRALLAVARSAMRAQIEGSKPPPPDHASTRLMEHRGVFVTLVSGGEVRACVGKVASDDPLISSVAEAAASAVSDPKAPTLTLKDLDASSIEISVLGGLRPLRDVLDLRPGIDGAVLQVPGHEGVVLPSDGAEGQAGLSDFLSRLAAKAGVPRTAWPKDSVKSFTTVELSDAAPTPSPAADAGRP